MMNCVLSVPKSLNEPLRMSAKARSLMRYVIKKRDAAQKLATTMVESPNDCIIVPFSDYPGPMIKEILSMRFSSLTVCEPNLVKRQELESFVVDVKPISQVYIEPDDLEQISMKTYCNESQKRCTDIMKLSCQNLNRFPSENPGKVKYLIPLRSFKGEMNILNHLYEHTAQRIGLYADNIYPQYYMLMTDRRLSFLEALSEEKNLRLYRSISIAFNTIFKVDNLLNFDLKNDFELKPRQIRIAKNQESSDIHLVRLEPRRSIVDLAQPESLLEYKYFVKQLMAKPTGKILPTLNKWFRINPENVPMIAFNITDKTRTGDMDEQLYWNLYQHVRSLPNYHESVFMQAYQSDNLRFTKEKDF